MNSNPICHIPKHLVQEHDQDDSNGLDIDEFEQAFRAILTRNDGLSKEEMKVMFMKIDTNCDGLLMITRLYYVR